MYLLQSLFLTRNTPRICSFSSIMYLNLVISDLRRHHCICRQGKINQKYLDYYTLVFGRGILWYSYVCTSIIPSIHPVVHLSVRWIFVFYIIVFLCHISRQNLLSNFLWITLDLVVFFIHLDLSCRRFIRWFEGMFLYWVYIIYPASVFHNFASKSHPALQSFELLESWKYFTNISLSL